MTAQPLRKICDNLLQPDDDKNPTKRRQNLGKILFDQSSKNNNQKTRTPWIRLLMIKNNKNNNNQNYMI